MPKHRKGYLFQRKKRGNYYLQYRIGGKLFSQCLGTADKDEAESKRAEIMDGLIVADEAAALESVAAKLDGKKRELEELAKQKALTIADAWLAYENAGNRGDIADSTMQMYSCYWQRFTRWLTEKYPDVKQLRQVTFEVAENYKTHMIRERKVTGKTFNEHRAFMLVFFRVLADKAKLDGNPWKQITRKQYKSKGREALTTEELIRVCRSAEGELRVMLALGLYLGARMGDAATMTWGNMHMRKQKVTYTPRKTAKSSDPLDIPMHPTLQAILSEVPPSDRKGYITPKMATLYLEKGPYAVSAIVQRHFKQCGLTTTRDGTGIKKLVSRGFHSLRHSAVSIMREAGVAQITSQAVVGHNSTEIHELYSHSDEAAMRRAVYALPAVIGENPQPLQVGPQMVEAEPIKKLVKKLNARNAKKVKAELLEMLA